ncbi:hypothetical protein MPSEU_000229700 [Mayamaea pseudoterrestris]|nr:hypothetical protein MPSEU_000229700 [Mayamaea pseudoterrestris]
MGRRRTRESQRDRASMSWEEEKKEMPLTDNLMQSNEEAAAAALRLGKSDEDNDEEEESDEDETSGSPSQHYYEDPYTYSDDSASLSDAYFFPQAGEDDLARPPRYNRQEQHQQQHLKQEELLLDTPPRQMKANTSVVFTDNVNYSTFYGAIGSYGGGGTDNGLVKSPPLWISGAIDENREQTITVSPIAYNYQEGNKLAIDSTHGSKSGRKQRRSSSRKSQQRLNGLRQQQASARERRVAQVKGRPQSTDIWRNPMFAILFLMQLLLVVGLAVYSVGSSERWSATRQKQHLSSASHHKSRSSLRSSSSSSLISKSQTETDSPSSKHQAHTHRALTVLHLNETTGDEQYTDDDQAVASLSVTHELNEDALQASSFLFPAPVPSELQYRSILILLSVHGCFAALLSICTYGFMLLLTRAIIPMTLIVSVMVTLGWGLLGMTLLDPYGFVSILGFAALLLTLTYTIYNWSRIQFAATNLHTSLCALRCTGDVALLGFGSLVVSPLWCIVWSTAFVGTAKAFSQGAADSCDAASGACVIKNVVRATVASEIGKWWYFDQDKSNFCCAPTFARPLRRALTKSFGSICLGSLVVPVAQVLSAMGNWICCVVGNSECLHQARKDEVAPGNAMRPHRLAMVEEGDSAADSVQLGSLICRLVRRVGLLLRACNCWSFTYIGMYGYPFHEAGEHALILFETREWLEVVSDNLIKNVLLISCLIIAGSTGTFAVLVEDADVRYLPTLHMATAWVFITGSVVGYALSSIFLVGVVGSAVNTVLVCFAADPFIFDKNHPTLSREMRESWSQQVWSSNG